MIEIQGLELPVDPNSAIDRYLREDTEPKQSIDLINERTDKDVFLRPMYVYREVIQDNPVMVTEYLTAKLRSNYKIQLRKGKDFCDVITTKEHDDLLDRYYKLSVDFNDMNNRLIFLEGLVNVISIDLKNKN